MGESPLSPLVDGTALGLDFAGALVEGLGAGLVLGVLADLMASDML